MRAVRLKDIDASLSEKYRLLDQLEASATLEAADLPSDLPSVDDLKVQIAALEGEMLGLLEEEERFDSKEIVAALMRLALPHWFSAAMMALIFPELATGEAERLLDALLVDSEVIRYRNQRGRYALSKRKRAEFLAGWYEPERRSELQEYSARLAAYCHEQAESTSEGAMRVEWTIEELYHLAAAAPDEAFVRLDDLLRESVDARFDLSQAEGWLRPLEERYELLDDWELERDPPARWTADLRERRNYLAARAYWTDAWYRTITYQHRQELFAQINRFLQPGPEDPTDAAWLLNLHALGGFGKTVLIEWLLSRELIARGFVCAHFDYDSLGIDRLPEVAEQPERILGYMAGCLNDQRAYKVTAFERQWRALAHPTLSGDAVVDFLRPLHEFYDGQPVVLFIDTIEELLNKTREPQRHLADLLNLLRRLRYGEDGGSPPLKGFANLKVVLSGRLNLLETHRAVLQEVLGTSDSEIPLDFASVQIKGFTPDEARSYLVDMRKLSGDKSNEKVVKAILDRSEATDEDGQPLGIGIYPLKLAMYADLVKGTSGIGAQSILEEDDVDLLILVERIIRRIANPDLRLLVRYGAIFRRMDVKAAQILLVPLDLAREGKGLDDPSKDHELMRAVLTQSRDRADEPRADLDDLLLELGRYSWVTWQKGIISFHPVVLKPQRKVLEEQRELVQELHHAAYEHYWERCCSVADTAEQVGTLREAIYHALHLSPEVSASLWRAAMERYEHGPGQVLWALVDETFYTSAVLSKPLLSRADSYRAFLALAQVELAEKDKPFRPSRPEQFKEAEELARRAYTLAATERESVVASMALAGAQLEQHKRQEALATAQECVSLSHLVDPQLEAEALQLLSRCLTANSRWGEAQEAIRQAYEITEQLVAAATPNEQVEAKAEMAEVLLDYSASVLQGDTWKRAGGLLGKVKRLVEDKIGDAQLVYWEFLGQFALKQARLAKAASSFDKVYRQSTGAKRKAVYEQLQRIQVLQGKSLNPDDIEGLEVALLAAAANGDRQGMELRLQKAKVEVPDEELLSVIDVLLQYYLEIASHWRQVSSMREKAARLLDSQPTDPAVARFHVLRRYIESLEEPIERLPSSALAQAAGRIAEAEALRTPEARVRAKAYLLLIRLYALQVGAPAGDKATELANQVYHACALLGLERTLDLLLDILAPIDQVDIMRTLNVVPGWSSSLVNQVAPSPGERNSLLLLQRALGLLEFSEEPALLVRVAAPSAEMVNEKLDKLGKQITEGNSDWPLLYTSYARLLRSFDRLEEARAFLHLLPSDASYDSLPAPAMVDLIYVLPWEKSRNLVAMGVKRLRYKDSKPEMAADVLLAACARWLEWDAPADALERVREWILELNQLISFQPPTLAYISYNLLTAVTAIKSGGPEAGAEAGQALSNAALTAKELGDPQRIKSIDSCRMQLQAWMERQQEAPAMEQTTAARALVDPGGVPLTGDMGAVSEEQIVAGGDIILGDVVIGNKIEIIQEASVAVRITPGYEKGLEITLDVREDGDELQVLLFGQAGGNPLEIARHRTVMLMGDVDGRPLFDDPTVDNTLRWQNLLLPDFSPLSLEALGARMLAQLLPATYQTRFAELLRQFADAPLAVRLRIEGRNQRHIPFGLLYLQEAEQWLSAVCHFSYNGRPLNLPPLQGIRLLLAPFAASNHAQGRVLKGTTDLYSMNRLARIGNASELSLERKQIKGSSAASTEDVASVHLIGEFGRWTDREGVFFSADKYNQWTPDALASALTRFGTSSSLIILEQLPTESVSEDVRALLWRNVFAYELSHLGGWIVLAAGPRYIRQGPFTLGFGHFLEELVNRGDIAVSDLDEMIRKTRQRMFADESRRGESVLPLSLQAQINLYYPTPVAVQPTAS